MLTFGLNFKSPGGSEEAVAEVVGVEEGPVVGGSKGVMKLYHQV